MSKHHLTFTVLEEGAPNQDLLVIAPQFTEEIRSANDANLSALMANCDIMQFRHTLHRIMESDQYHNAVVQKQLTQSLGPRLPDIVDEAKKSFNDEIGYLSKSQDFVMWDKSFAIVTRTANRLLFGPELAKDKGFLRLSIDFSYVMFGGADLVRAYPEILKPIIMWWKTSLYRSLAEARGYLIPILTERIILMKSHEKEGTMSDWAKTKPNDCIQWVLDITPPDKRDATILVYRMLHINIAAVHTSSVTFLDCVYELANHPEIHDELRSEVTEVFAREGDWQKQGLTKLIKMDSFMRETVRFNPLFSSNLDRIALKDTKLSDGLLIPKGTYVTTPSYPKYMDNDYYPDAHVFDAFRFSKQRTEPGQETNFSFVQTSTNYLHFGHGKHACPGRFFASNEIKVLLVLLLMNYDVSLKEPGKRPANMWFTKSRTPDPRGIIRWISRKHVPDYAKLD
ncbi:hypothetical protein PV11_03496 [Exophiala sideris]|uniref:Cytochrome P450 n=1 Tax=Exophiala sideris TaxID=1016849 RepID=A0A0D1X1E2_9EURO|nr:hypothetical protein PV11_03496 [Exophiala sideris]